MLSRPNAQDQERALECRAQIHAHKSDPRSVAAVAFVAVVSVTSAAAQSPPAPSPAEQRGLTFARLHCAQCHSLDVVSESPIKIAPPFRDLQRKYPVDNLRRPLSEGIIANHPTMPQFRLDADQVNDVIAFMKSLER
jgi:cytochrome c